jgi:hypothetical protein
MQPDRENRAVYCLLAPLYNGSIMEFALLPLSLGSNSVPNLA